MRLFRVLRDKPRVTWDGLILKFDPLLTFWGFCFVFDVMTWKKWRETWGFGFAVLGGILGFLAVVILPVVAICGTGPTCS